MRLKYILAASLLLIANASSPAASRDSSSDKTISACRIELTPLGKTARFHFDYIYIVETGDNGAVRKVTQIAKGKRPAFVQEDKIIECIKTWKLTPSGRHSVLFSVGTSGDENYISIVDPDRNKIKLLLR